MYGSAGTIRSSLSQAINDPALVSLFVDVFAFDLDFYVDQHSGDSFRMLVQSRHTGGELLKHERVLAAEYAGTAGAHRAFLWTVPGTQRARYFDAEGNAEQMEFRDGMRVS